MTEILTQGVQFCQPDNPLEWAVAMRDFLEREPDEGAAVRLKRHVSETYSRCRSVDELLQVLKGACELAEGDHVRTERAGHASRFSHADVTSLIRGAPERQENFR